MIGDEWEWQACALFLQQVVLLSLANLESFVVKNWVGLALQCWLYSANHTLCCPEMCSCFEQIVEF